MYPKIMLIISYLGMLELNGNYAYVYYYVSPKLICLGAGYIGKTICSYANYLFIVYYSGQDGNVLNNATWLYNVAYVSLNIFVVYFSK